MSWIFIPIMLGQHSLWLWGLRIMRIEYLLGTRLEELNSGRWVVINQKMNHWGLFYWFSHCWALVDVPELLVVWLTTPNFPLISLQIDPSCMPIVPFLRSIGPSQKYPCLGHFLFRCLYYILMRQCLNTTEKPTAGSKFMHSSVCLCNPSI